MEFDGIKNMRKNSMGEDAIKKRAITQECIDAVEKIVYK